MSEPRRDVAGSDGPPVEQETAGRAGVPDYRLVRRVCQEFREMPGVRLTLQQACRLWSVQNATARQTLEHLVGARVLRRHGVHYLRAEHRR